METCVDEDGYLDGGRVAEPLRRFYKKWRARIKPGWLWAMGPNRIFPRLSLHPLEMHNETFDDEQRSIEKRSRILANDMSIRC